MIRIGVRSGTARDASADVLVHMMFEGWQTSPEESGILRSLTGADFVPEKGTGFSGKERETLLLFPKGLASARLLLVGAGSRTSWSSERLRRAGATAAKALRDMGVRTAAVVEPERRVTAPLAAPGEDPAEAYGCAIAEGMFLGLYTFDRYKSKRTPDLPAAVTLLAGSSSREKGIGKGVGYARVVCAATCLARDLSNAPGNVAQNFSNQNTGARGGQFQSANGNASQALLFNNSRIAGTVTLDDTNKIEINAMPVTP